MESQSRKIPLADGWRMGGQPVALPHTWNAEDGITNHYDRSLHTYETLWTPDPALRSFRVYLEVEAANSIAVVRVNGRSLTTHRGGYSLFRVEVTDALVWDRDNRLEIDVDNSESEEVYPLMADFTFFGGLYRGVSLVVVPPVHFDLLDHGSSGLYLSQTDVTAERAVVRCEAKVVNQSGVKAVVTCQVRARDHAGTVVAEFAETATVTEATSFVRALVVPKPTLWQGVANPYLYRVEASLTVDGVVVDTRAAQLGLRNVVVDPVRGFVLNGEPTPLRGVSRHQDRAGAGWALTQEHLEEDMALLREIGANTVRLAHYQHHDAFLDLCDRHGLVVWAEIPFISRLSKTDPTGENAVGQLVELIRQNYNHSSICFWGVQNEITIGGVNLEVERLVAKLHRLAKSEDPWRLSTQAQVGHLPDGHRLNAVTDIVAYNQYFGWYYKETGDFELWIQAFHAAQPALALGVSEYGAEGLMAYHSDHPRVKDYTEEYHALYHETAYGVFEKHPELWGTYVWNMFDFASSIRDEGGVQGRNNKGLVSHDRKTRKDAFWFYKASWSAQPVLHLTSKRYVERTTATVDVKAYSNRPGAQLLLNGATYAGEAAGVVVVFRGVPLAKGENVLTLRCGELTDTLRLVRVDVATVDYTCPAKSGRGPVANWFSADVALDGDVVPLAYPEGRFSIRDSIADILAVAAGEALLRRYLAPMFSHPMFTLARNFSLARVAEMDTKTFTPAVLSLLNTKLNAIAKPPKAAEAAEVFF